MISSCPLPPSCRAAFTLIHPRGLSTGASPIPGAFFSRPSGTGSSIARVSPRARALGYCRRAPPGRLSPPILPTMPSQSVLQPAYFRHGDQPRTVTTGFVPRLSFRHHLSPRHEEHGGPRSLALRRPRERFCERRHSVEVSFLRFSVPSVSMGFSGLISLDVVQWNTTDKQADYRRTAAPWRHSENLSSYVVL